MHEASAAAPAERLDHEIGRRRLRARDLRSNARVSRREPVIAQRRPVSANGPIERIATARVDRVVERLRIEIGAEPLDVRAEADAAGEIERGVHAETAVLGQRIHEMRERAAARVREVVAFGKEGARDRRARRAELVRETRRMQPGGVDDRPRRQRERAVARRAFELHRGAGRTRGRAARVRGDRAAGSFEVASQRQHERVAVDDAGRRRPETRDCLHVRLETLDVARRRVARDRSRRWPRPTRARRRACHAELPGSRRAACHSGGAGRACCRNTRTTAVYPRRTGAPSSSRADSRARRESLRSCAPTSLRRSLRSSRAR